MFLLAESEAQLGDMNKDIGARLTVRGREDRE